MSVRQFLKLVEIQTKVASILPFIIGIVYAVYRYEQINVLILLPLFLSLICIDFATTALNNLIDFQRDSLKEGYHYEVHNAIGHYGLSTKKVKLIIVALIIIGGLLGIGVALMTDVIVFLLGVIAFGIGILYSFGPIPIARTPLGELFSGLFMGFLIFFIVVYTQIVDLGFININVIESVVKLSVDYVEVIILFFISLPMVMGIANIMLANNISDVKEDIKNNRFTLPYFIGHKNSMLLFDALTFVPFIVVTINVGLKLLPVTALLVWLAVLLIKKNADAFHQLQSKEKTFVFVVKNFILFCGIYTIGILLGDIVRFVLK